MLTRRSAPAAPIAPAALLLIASLLVVAMRAVRAKGRETMDGGGAVFVRGGWLKVVNVSFVGNRCAAAGPDGSTAGASRVFRGRCRGTLEIGVPMTMRGSRRATSGPGGGIVESGVPLHTRGIDRAPGRDSVSPRRG